MGGCKGANAAKITKLFSAAQWWGPGQEGWQRWDDTWLLTDKRDVFGRVVAEQGRIVWSLASGTPCGRQTLRSRHGPAQSIPSMGEHRQSSLTSRVQGCTASLVVAIVF